MLKYYKPKRAKLTTTVSKKTGRKMYSFTYKGKVFRFHRMEKCSNAPLGEIKYSGYNVFCPVHKILVRKIGQSRKEVRIQPFTFI